MKLTELNDSVLINKRVAAVQAQLDVYRQELTDLQGKTGADVSQKRQDLNKKISDTQQKIRDIRSGKDTDDEQVSEHRTIKVPPTVGSVSLEQARQTARELSEGFGDPVYLIKRMNVDEFSVAKFTDRKEPEAVYHVYEKRKGDYVTNSPGFKHRGGQEKHIKLVKQWLKDGEPSMTAYKIDATGKITKTKFVK